MLDLLALKRDVPDTRIVWFMRRATLEKAFGDGTADVRPCAWTAETVQSVATKSACC